MVYYEYEDRGIRIAHVGAGGSSVTKDELLSTLAALSGAHDDPEHEHFVADAALLAYINDPEITAAYEAIDKWYG